MYKAPTLERNLIFHRARVVVAGQIGVLILRRPNLRLSLGKRENEGRERKSRSFALAVAKLIPMAPRDEAGHMLLSDIIAIVCRGYERAITLEFPKIGQKVARFHKYVEQKGRKRTEVVKNVLVYVRYI